MTGVNVDPSNGYDAIYKNFIRFRTESGVSVIRDWADRFTPGSSILDLGAGSGLPLTPALLEAGLTVSAIDASPKMVATYKLNFPDHEVVCEAVETSSFLGRRFDGILAVGLLFLLSERAQRRLIGRVSKHLKIKGRFFVSAPAEICAWTDSLTGRRSQSLGMETYQICLEAAGLCITDRIEDRNGNFYIDARKSRNHI